MITAFDATLSRSDHGGAEAGLFLSFSKTGSDLDVDLVTEEAQLGTPDG